MIAVVGVLNESLTESIKGFYKLRKAYITLDSILGAEARFVRAGNGTGNNTPRKISFESLRSNKSARSIKEMPGGFGEGQQNKTEPQGSHRAIQELKENHIAQQDQASGIVEDSVLDDEDDEFYDADEVIDRKPGTYAGHLDFHDVNGNLADISIDDEGNYEPKDLPPPRILPVREGILHHDPDSDIFANPIDAFVHSGANVWFGLLLLMISMIPPAFGKLLFIIGFRGDRDRGLRLLWQASKFHNINGAMAGLILLGYYNSFINFSDIIPEAQSSSTVDDSVEGYPKERCETLLADMRRRHPKSHLWLLEEARMQAANRHLSTAISLLSNSSKSPLKQVEALMMFEKSLDAMYTHDYTLCAASFTACVSLNNWSHTLYFYIAGAAHVELYRHYKFKLPKAADLHAKKATELLKTAPKHAGKKRFMARQLPFDIFVTRKIHKWEHRAHEWKIEFIDAVGVSPIEEMIYLWSGYKRMDPSQLETSLAALAWSEDPISNPTWPRDTPDERAILGILRGTTLRNLGRWDQAADALRTGVLGIDKAELKGGHRDDWTAPAAHYEMGVVCWMRKADSEGNKGGAGKNKDEATWVRECEEWVDKAARWEGYELDARIGIKVTTAQDTLKKWKDER